MTTEGKDSDHGRFSQFMLEAENILNEFVIAVLSFGAIFVPIYLFFFESERFTWYSLGDHLAPWVIMVALMIIARELWLINRNLNKMTSG